MAKLIQFTRSVLAIGSLFSSFEAFAGPGPASFSYEGRLYDLSGNPSVQTVNVEASILGKGSSCVLRSEQFTGIDLSASNGYFSITVGTGSSVQGLNLGHLLLNSGTLTGVSSCTYTPVAGDSRLLHVRISNDGGSTWTDLSPDVEIGSAPYAMVADTVQGKSAADFLQLGANAQMTQPNIEGLFATPANLAELQALANGNSQKYAKASSSAGVLIPTSSAQPASPQTGQMWYENGTLRFWNGTAAQTLGTGTSLSSLTVGAGLVDGSGSPGTNITGAGGAIALPNVGTAGTYFKVTTDGFGRVTAGVGTLSESDVPTLSTAGKVNGSAINGGTIGGATAINTSGNISTSGNLTASSLSSSMAGVNSLQIFKAGNANKVSVTSPTGLSADYALVLPPSLPGSSGQVLTSDTAGNLSWSAAAGGSISSVSATAPLSVTNATTAPSLTIAQASTSSGGYLSSADWNTFNGKLGTSLASGQIWVGNGGGTATAVGVSGDLSANNAGLFTVNGIKGRPVSAAPSLAGQVLRYDGTNITPAFVAMTDLRSSVTGTNQFTNSCGANQTLTYNSVGDSMGCTNIAISASQVSGGALSVASVGIGTTSPTAKLDVQDSFGSTSGEVYGGYSKMTSSYTGGTYEQPTVSGFKGEVNVPTTGAYNATTQFIGVKGVYTKPGVSASYARGYGVYGDAANPATGGSGGNLYGVYGISENNSGGGVAETMYGVGAQVFGIGTVNNEIAGVLVDMQYATMTVPNAYGLKIKALGGGTNRYGLYQMGASDRNYFAGLVGIGTTSPAVSLDVGSFSDAIALPKGTTAQQPVSAAPGWIRYNTTNNAIEYYNGSAWTTLSAAGGSYMSTSGGTMSGALTITGGGASVTGGINNNSGGITGAGSITGVGANITGSGAMTVAAGGAAQNLTLSSSTTGSVNVGSGNGTSLSVLDGGASTVNYVAVKGAATGASPTIGTGGADANINLAFSPKGTGNTIFASGNVGVGTTAPAFKFHVFEAAADAVGRFETASSSNIAKLYLSTPSTHWFLANKGSANNNNFVISQTGTDRMLIDGTSGFVGIGTTTPANPLEVMANINAPASVVMRNPSSSTGAQAGFRALNNNATPSSMSMGINSTTFTAGGLYSADTGYLVSDSPYGMNIGTTYSGSSQIRFFTGGGVPTQRMVIDNAGNVGIGTTAPNANLDVFGTFAVRGMNAISFPTSDTAAGGSIAIGNQALSSQNGLGSALYGNVAIGYYSMSGMSTNTTTMNTAVGYQAMQYSSSGAASNSAFGANALQVVTSGNSNAALGMNALKNLTTGSGNVAIGARAGFDTTTGNNNIVLGSIASTGFGITTGSNNIMIGYDVRPPATAGNNQLNIGNLIYASGLGSGATLSAGSVGIGTSTPAGILDVNPPMTSGGVGSDIFLRAQSSSMVSGTGGSIQLIPGAGGASGMPGSVVFNGKIASAGSMPTVTCTAGGTMGSGSTDTRGSVNFTSGSVSSCNITFNKAYQGIPYCVVSWASNVSSSIFVAPASTAAVLQVNFGTAVTGGGTFNYICMQ